MKKHTVKSSKVVDDRYDIVKTIWNLKNAGLSCEEIQKLGFTEKDLETFEEIMKNNVLNKRVKD